MKMQGTNNRKESAMNGRSNKWMSRGCGLLLVAIGISLLPMTEATAVIVNLDTTGDTILMSAQPNLNQGGNSASFVGNAGGYQDYGRDLFSFDVSSIPSDAIVQSATLRIAFTGNNDGSTRTLSLYQLTSSWTESGATWNSRDGANNWGTGGGDYVGTASTSLTDTFNGSNGSRVDFSFPNLAADVQSWVASPGSNKGWILINNEETNFVDTHKQFWNREQVGYGAVLDVTYYTVPEPSVVALLGVAALTLANRRRTKR